MVLKAAVLLLPILLSLGPSGARAADPVCSPDRAASAPSDDTVFGQDAVALAVDLRAGAPAFPPGP